LIYEHGRALLSELTTKDKLEDLGIDGKIILKYNFKKYDVWTKVTCFRTETSGGLLWKLY